MEVETFQYIKAVFKHKKFFKHKKNFDSLGVSV